MWSEAFAALTDAAFERMLELLGDPHPELSDSAE
jgi:hypothetical protein